MTHGYKEMGSLSYGLKSGCLQLKRGWLALLILNALAIDTLAAGSPESLAHAFVLRDRAMAGSTAMQIVTSLTTEVGPRLAGSEAEARARHWALALLNEKGFANVRNEPFEMDAWQRHAEGAEILAPYPNPWPLRR